MYKNIPAIIINSLFGLCLAYDVIIKALAEAFKKTETKSLIGFFIFDVVWIVLFLAYNIKRYKVTKGGNMYWITLLVPFLPWSVIMELLFCLER